MDTASSTARHGAPDAPQKKRARTVRDLDRRVLDHGLKLVALMEEKGMVVRRRCGGCRWVSLCVCRHEPPPTHSNDCARRCTPHRAGLRWAGGKGPLPWGSAGKPPRMMERAIALASAEDACGGAYGGRLRRSLRRTPAEDACVGAAHTCNTCNNTSEYM
jgi:hypothetical protein